MKQLSNNIPGTMRPAAFVQPHSHDDFCITQLPTPQDERFCQHGQMSVHWSVNEGNAHMTLPDWTIGFRTELITLAGIYTAEMNRFDAATRFDSWNSKFVPNVSQKKGICQYFGHIISQWKDDLSTRMKAGSKTNRGPAGPSQPSTRNQPKRPPPPTPHTSTSAPLEGNPSHETPQVPPPGPPNVLTQQNLQTYNSAAYAIPPGVVARHFSSVITPDHPIHVNPNGHPPFIIGSPYSLANMEGGPNGPTGDIHRPIPTRIGVQMIPPPVIIPSQASTSAHAPNPRGPPECTHMGPHTHSTMGPPSVPRPIDITPLVIDEDPQPPRPDTPIYAPERQGPSVHPPSLAQIPEERNVKAEILKKIGDENLLRLKLKRKIADVTTSIINPSWEVENSTRKPNQSKEVPSAPPNSPAMDRKRVAIEGKTKTA